MFDGRIALFYTMECEPSAFWFVHESENTPETEENWASRMEDLAFRLVSHPRTVSDTFISPTKEVWHLLLGFQNLSVPAS